MAQLIMQEEASNPSTPGSGKWSLYPKADGLYIIDDAGKISGPIVGGDGWTAVSETWTYASASTITIPSNGTTKYQKGMKIRFKQGGGYKYAVASVVAATLITILVNTDHTVANAAITDVSYSFIERPFGWPDLFSFTGTTSASGSMTWTVSTIALSKYKVSGKTVTLFLDIVGTTGGTASNTLQYSIPFTPTAFTFSFDVCSDTGALASGYCFASTGSYIGFRKADASNFGFGANREAATTITFEW